MALISPVILPQQPKESVMDKILKGVSIANGVVGTVEGVATMGNKIENAKLENAKLKGAVTAPDIAGREQSKTYIPGSTLMQLINESGDVTPIYVGGKVQEPLNPLQEAERLKNLAEANKLNAEASGKGKENPLKNKFMESTMTAQGKDYEKLQSSQPKIDEQLSGIDDAINAQIEYTKNTKYGTGPLASGYGLKGILDTDTANLKAKFNKLALKNLVTDFAGMSKAVDTDAERRAFESTQPSIKNDDRVNVSILLGGKSIALKNKAEAEAQKAYVENNGSLNGYASPIIGKVDTVVDKNGNMKLVPKNEKDQYLKSGYLGLDNYARTVVGEPIINKPTSIKPTSHADLEKMTPEQLRIYLNGK
jgi:hypothetical protein